MPCYRPISSALCPVSISPPRESLGCTQLEYQPLQLQRFLRGCVLATARRLVIPPANEFRLVHARAKTSLSGKII